MPEMDEHKKIIYELEKKILLLERKLKQDNLSRMLIEEAHDRYQNIYKHVLLEQTKQKEELEEARNVLKERTIELESANLQLKLSKEKAEQSDRFKSEFLANMSHEIRTPMNAIIGYLSLLEKTDLNSDQSEYVGQIKTASEMLLFLVNDILDLSKIESGKMVFEDKDFSLRKVITESASMNVPRAREKGITLNISYDNSIPEPLRGDPMRIMQVLNNLLTNAVKFTEKGGVTLKAVHTGAFGKRSKIFIAVSDTGTGIKDEEKDSLFEPFIQAKSVRDEKIGGTGLGLTISRKIINQMGSEIYVDSEYGRGSTFYFDLVLERSGNGVQSPVNEKRPVSGTEIKKDISILIAEDNLISLRLFHKMIKGLGLNADTAVTGTEAVERSRKKAYNLIFMDNIMPEKNGYEAAKEIRSTGKSRNAVIIGITAGVLKEEKDLLNSSGINDCLYKPVRSDDVRQIIIKYFSAGPQV
jgi:signal transduction histidine kinase/ActR/RegA family two-component response regulator